MTAAQVKADKEAQVKANKWRAGIRHPSWTLQRRAHLTFGHRKWVGQDVHGIPPEAHDDLRPFAEYDLMRRRKLARGQRPVTVGHAGVVDQIPGKIHRARRRFRARTGARITTPSHNHYFFTLSACVG
jgi:hypothetical protein